MQLTCFYHGDHCLDGFAAAWVVQRRYPDARFIAVNYNELPPTLPEGRVLMVDFMFQDRTVMDDIITAADHVTVYDHHDGSAALFQELHDVWPTSRFSGIHDVHRSGAGITWDALFPQYPRPRLVKHVEDRDLWRFKYVNSEAFCEALGQLPQTFRSFDYANEISGFNDLVALGRPAVMEREERCREVIASNRHQITLELPDRVLEIPAVKTPYPKERSELASLLLRDLDVDIVAVTWYTDTPGRQRVRLVSRRNGPNVSDIAKHFGGGGHTHAAGFYLSV